MIFMFDDTNPIAIYPPGVFLVFFKDCNQTMTGLFCTFVWGLRSAFYLNSCPFVASS